MTRSRWEGKKGRAKIERKEKEVRRKKIALDKEAYLSNVHRAERSRWSYLNPPKIKLC
jgi:hypothetical protein